MDPNATLQDILQCIAHREWIEAREATKDLYELLERRGYPPLATGEQWRDLLLVVLTGISARNKAEDAAIDRFRPPQW